MYSSKLKLMILSILSFLSIGINAQTVKLQVQDTAIQSKVVFAVVSRLAPLKMVKPVFDKKGNAVILDTCTLADKKSMLVIDQKMLNLFTKAGSMTNIKVTKKTKNDLQLFYKGYASDVYVLQDSISSGYSYPKYFSLVGDKSETLKNYDAKIAMLDGYHNALLSQVQKIQEKELVPSFTKSIECEYLRFKLSLMRAYDKAHDIDVLDDVAYQNLLNKIDLNDSEFEAYSLISQYLKGKVSSKLENNPIAWGCEFVKQIKKYIADPKMKQQMDLQAIQYVTTYAAGDDIDQFWVPFKAVADSAVVKAYEAKIESLKNTKVGMPAYDSEFLDVNGGLHRISEFKGKLLYVDFWATWCGPCKAEIPHLAKLVEHYKGNDKVQFISVSVDENVDAWKKMIAKDNPQWPQFIASKEQHAKISKDWGIVGIPRFLLINVDGTINNADAIRPSDSQLIPLIDKLIK